MIQVNDEFDHEKHGRVTVKRFQDAILGVDPDTGEKHVETTVEFSYKGGYPKDMHGGPKSMTHTQTEVLESFMASVEGAA